MTHPPLMRFLGLPDDASDVALLGLPGATGFRSGRASGAQGAVAVPDRHQVVRRTRRSSSATNSKRPFALAGRG